MQPRAPCVLQELQQPRQYQNTTGLLLAALADAKERQLRHVQQLQQAQLERQALQQALPQYAGAARTLPAASASQYGLGTATIVTGAGDCPDPTFSVDLPWKIETGWKVEATSSVVHGVAHGGARSSGKTLPEEEEQTSTNDGEEESRECTDDGDSDDQSVPTTAAASGQTTLMVRNVPVMYTQEMLMEEWPNDGSYDFLYLPRSGAGRWNLSYAFINFASEAQALNFKAQWQKKRLASFTAKKPLNISFAEVQGLEANLAQLKKKRVRWQSHFVVVPKGQDVSKMQQA